MLLVAEPSMGKSMFLSHVAHEIKKLNPLVSLLRINLNEHTKELEGIEFEQECINRCKMFIWNAAHSTEQDGLEIKRNILSSVGKTDKMIIILDGFDDRGKSVRVSQPIPAPMD
jgi:transcription termination factor Rho